MKTTKMPTLYVNVKGRKKPLRIPGGWLLRVPEISALDPTTQRAYESFFKRSKGLTDAEAHAKVLKIFSDLLASSWYRMQVLAIKRWAKVYAGAYPEKVRENGELEGFAPEKLQSLYVPGSNYGKSGKTAARTLFREMANEEDR